MRFLPVGNSRSCGQMRAVDQVVREAETMDARRYLIRTKNVAFLDVAAADLECQRHRTRGEKIPADLEIEHADALGRYGDAVAALAAERERRRVAFDARVSELAILWRREILPVVGGGSP